MSNNKPASGADDFAASPSLSRANEALRLMQQALDLIDEAHGPDAAGADLDSAIHRLRNWLESPPKS
jgi:hypothetical protein